MTKRARIDAWIAEAIALKEKQVATNDFDGDLPPIVQGFRQNRLVARVQAPEVNRDQALQAVRIVATAFEADEVWVVLDTHLTYASINPATGKEWGPGEMAQACEAGACDADLITDALFLIRATRDGGFNSHAQTYHVHKSDRTVVWGKAMELHTRAGHDGLVPDSIRSSFDSPTAASVLIDAGVISELQRTTAQKVAISTAVKFFALGGYDLQQPEQ